MLIEHRTRELETKFHKTTGHLHTGAEGDGPIITAGGALVYIYEDTTLEGQAHTLKFTTNLDVSLTSNVATVSVAASPSFTGLTISTFTTAGILHNAVTTGAVSSSLIVQADIGTGLYLPTTTDQSNWNTAYGWGDHSTLYLKLLGRAGGQTANGGTAAGDNLILSSTADAGKGLIYVGGVASNGHVMVDEANALLSSLKGVWDVTGGLTASSLTSDTIIVTSLATGLNIIAGQLTLPNSASGYPLYLGDIPLYKYGAGEVYLGGTFIAPLFKITDGTNLISLEHPTLSGSYTFIFPTSMGSNTNIMTSDGSKCVWANPALMTVGNATNAGTATSAGTCTGNSLTATTAFSASNGLGGSLEVVTSLLQVKRDATGGIGLNSGGIFINDEAVTYARMQHVSATSRVLGRIAAGAGDVEELTAANLKTMCGYYTSDDDLTMFLSHQVFS